MATSDQILAQIKRRITMPANGRLLDDEAILDICDEVLKVKITPMIVALRQEFLLTLEEETTVTEKYLYDIPYRAVGRTLRDLKLRWQDDQTIELVQVQLEDKQFFTGNNNALGVPVGYYFMGDKIRLVPAPQADTYVLEKYYEIAISNLVKVDESAYVSSVDFDNHSVIVANVPDNLSPGTLIDFIAGRPGHSIMSFDIEIDNIVGNQIVFNPDTVPLQLRQGDWISYAQTSPVVQIPEELTVYFADMAAERCLYAVGDFMGLDKLKAETKVELADMQSLMEPRNRGAPAKIINRRGLLRRGPTGYWQNRNLVGP